MVYAGSQSASFVQATKDLEALAELSVSRERVQRWTKRIGRERVAEMEAQAAAYQDLPLPAAHPSDRARSAGGVRHDGRRADPNPLS